MAIEGVVAQAGVSSSTDKAAPAAGKATVIRGRGMQSPSPQPGASQSAVAAPRDVPRSAAEEIELRALGQQRSLPAQPLTAEQLGKLRDLLMTEVQGPRLVQSLRKPLAGVIAVGAIVGLVGVLLVASKHKTARTPGFALMFAGFGVALTGLALAAAGRSHALAANLSARGRVLDMPRRLQATEPDSDRAVAASLYRLLTTHERPGQVAHIWSHVPMGAEQLATLFGSDVSEVADLLEDPASRSERLDRSASNHATAINSALQLCMEAHLDQQIDAHTHALAQRVLNSMLRSRGAAFLYGERLRAYGDGTLQGAQAARVIVRGLMADLGLDAAGVDEALARLERQEQAVQPGLRGAGSNWKAPADWEALGQIEEEPAGSSTAV